MKKIIYDTVAENHLFKYMYTFFKNRKYLVCPASLPLYEIFYYDEWGEIKRHLNASPRSVVQMALSSPHHYLQVYISTVYIYLQYIYIYRYIYSIYTCTSTGICTFTGISMSSLIKISCFDTYTTTVEHQNPLL